MISVISIWLSCFVIDSIDNSYWIAFDFVASAVNKLFIKDIRLNYETQLLKKKELRGIYNPDYEDIEIIISIASQMGRPSKVKFQELLVVAFAFGFLLAWPFFLFLPVEI